MFSKRFLLSLLFGLLAISTLPNVSADTVQAEINQQFDVQQLEQQEEQKFVQDEEALLHPETMQELTEQQKLEAATLKDLLSQPEVLQTDVLRPFVMSKPPLSNGKIQPYSLPPSTSQRILGTAEAKEADSSYVKRHSRS